MKLADMEGNRIGLKILSVSVRYGAKQIYRYRYLFDMNPNRIIGIDIGIGMVDIGIGKISRYIK